MYVTSILATVLMLLAMLQRTLSESLVISIGDGYAAGTGIYDLRSKYDDEGCLSVQDKSPGGRYAKQFALQHINLACADADAKEPAMDTIDKMLTNWNQVTERYTDEVATGFDGSVIILTVGLGMLYSYKNERAIDMDRKTSFFGIIQDCLKHPLCSLNDNLFDMVNVQSLQTQFEILLERLATDAPNARIFVVEYPVIFESYLFCSMPGISRWEAKAIDQVVLDWNEKMYRAVTRVQDNLDPSPDMTHISNAYYTDMLGACAFSPLARGIQRLSPTLWQSSFHPNQRGYDETLARLQDAD